MYFLSTSCITVSKSKPIFIFLNFHILLYNCIKIAKNILSLLCENGNYLTKYYNIEKNNSQSIYSYYFT